ncbi:MAG TPA: pyruvate kinase [Candidatus Wirthbacteria bacterium]|nr:pyruvate kinase [Candidatus Wirthbacteria bacterium]
MIEKLTKVICTVGPGSCDFETLEKMYLSGMNIVRFNFKHGDHAWFESIIKTIREIEKKHHAPIGLMQDLQGLDIRIGTFKKDQPVELKKGDKFVLRTNQKEGDSKGVSISLQDVEKYVNVGDHILINDGALELVAQDVIDGEIISHVLRGGILENKKGVNIPGKHYDLPPLAEKDLKDIEFAIKHNFDFIALSFVQSAADVGELRKLLTDIPSEDNKFIKIISKIESISGLKNFDEVLAASDGIMVARGDLGVELPYEEVPVVQKQIITKCNAAGKAVIVATQMLDSMERNPSPTRAEVSDVANAILDNADAIMLSGETAKGKYPVLAVETMSKIVRRMEDLVYKQRIYSTVDSGEPEGISESIAKQACSLAREMDAKAILTLTTSGNTARLVSRFRPLTPIYAASPYRKVERHLLLTHGIIPFYLKLSPSRDFRMMLEESLIELKQFDRLQEGDNIVVTAGLQATGEPGGTNLLYVHTVEDDPGILCQIKGE